MLYESYQRFNSKGIDYKSLKSALIPVYKGHYEIVCMFGSSRMKALGMDIQFFCPHTINEIASDNYVLIDYLRRYCYQGTTRYL